MQRPSLKSSDIDTLHSSRRRRITGEHSFESRERYKQAAANANCRDFLTFSRLICGSSRNSQDQGRFPERDNATLRLRGFKAGVHFSSPIR
jgi:hypothetical protein